MENCHWFEKYMTWKIANGLRSICCIENCHRATQKMKKEGKKEGRQKQALCSGRYLWKCNHVRSPPAAPHWIGGRNNVVHDKVMVGRGMIIGQDVHGNVYLACLLVVDDVHIL